MVGISAKLSARAAMNATMSEYYQLPISDGKRRTKQVVNYGNEMKIGKLLNIVPAESRHYIQCQPQLPVPEASFIVALACFPKKEYKVMCI